MQKDPLKLVSTRIFTAQIMCFSSKSVGRPPTTGMGARNRQPVIRTNNQSTVKEVPSGYVKIAIENGHL
jgi:hypothetical protein